MATGGAEARHALHKAPKAPGDQEHQHPFVPGHRGEHPLDALHGPGAHRQIIGEHRRHDHQRDGPQGHDGSLQAAGQNLRPRTLPVEQGQQHGKRQRQGADLIGGAFPDAEGHSQPEDGKQSKHKPHKHSQTLPYTVILMVEPKENLYAPVCFFQKQY